MHYAHDAGSGYIEPEHILEGLLKEDPQLFEILFSDKPSLVADLKALLVEDRQPAAVGTARIGLPLSPTSRDVVVAAAAEQKQLGHRQVATQHLLLALITTPRKSARWFAPVATSSVQKLFAQHEITEELVRSKTKDGVITPTTCVLDDAVILLNGQLGALAEILVSKGLMSRAEFTAALDQYDGPLPPEIFLSPLIDALGQNGVLTPSDQTKTKDAGGATNPMQTGRSSGSEEKQ
jgi:ATP-dependent Clp protease ATP-binding subunit ClpA